MKKIIILAAIILATSCSVKDETSDIQKIKLIEKLHIERTKIDFSPLFSLAKNGLKKEEFIKLIEDKYKSFGIKVLKESEVNNYRAFRSKPAEVKVLKNGSILTTVKGNPLTLNQLSKLKEDRKLYMINIKPYLYGITDIDHAFCMILAGENCKYKLQLQKIINSNIESTDLVLINSQFPNQQYLSTSGSIFSKEVTNHLYNYNVSQESISTYNEHTDKVDSSLLLKEKKKKVAITFYKVDHLVKRYLHFFKDNKFVSFYKIEKGKKRPVKFDPKTLKEAPFYSSYTVFYLSNIDVTITIPTSKTYLKK